MSEQNVKPIPPDVGDIKQITIAGIADAILQLEYRQKGLADPDPAKLLEMAQERYERSKQNGDDNHLGTAKPKQ